VLETVRHPANLNRRFAFFLGRKCHYQPHDSVNWNGEHRAAPADFRWPLAVAVL
jgi:hypothetical protein